MKLVTRIPGPCPAVGDWALIDDGHEELFGYISAINSDLQGILLRSSPSGIYDCLFMYPEIKLLLRIIELDDQSTEGVGEASEAGEADMLQQSNHFGPDQ